MRPTLLFGLLLVFLFPGVARADNVSNLREQVSEVGVWANERDNTPAIYRQCVPWLAPWWPCENDHLRLNVAVNRTDLWNELKAELAHDWENVPVPTSGFKPGGGTDKPAVVVNDTPYGHDYFEFWNMLPDGASWKASWGGGAESGELGTSDGVKYWLGQSWPCRFSTGTCSEPKFGVTGSGLTFVPMVIEITDLKAGQINHPVMLSVRNACTSWKAPARKSDGQGGTDCVQYGAKFQLPASVDVDAITTTHRWCGQTTCPLTPLAKMIAKAAQTHYLIAADQTGHNVVFSLESYDRPRTGHWTNVPTGNPYPAYRGCDGLQNSGHWNAAPVAPGDWEQDCAPAQYGAFAGFPWHLLVELP